MKPARFRTFLPALAVLSLAACGQSGDVPPTEAPLASDGMAEPASPQALPVAPVGPGGQAAGGSDAVSAPVVPPGTSELNPRGAVATPESSRRQVRPTSSLARPSSAPASPAPAMATPHPAPQSTPADPHAGHDMQNMGDHDMDAM